MDAYICIHHADSDADDDDDDDADDDADNDDLQVCFSHLRSGPAPPSTHVECPSRPHHGTEETERCTFPGPCPGRGGGEKTEASEASREFLVELRPAWPL